MNKKRTRYFLGLAASVLGTLAAQGGAGAQGRNTVVLAELFGAKSGFALETDDAQVLTKSGCMEMLTRIDFDGIVKPGLATAWTQSSPTTWDFTLRPGVKFTDGKPVDAQTVVDDLNRTLKAAAPARSFSPRAVSGVSALDDHTVRITTPAPSMLVPLRMASPNTGILSPAAFTGDRVNPANACTGPFTVTEEVPRQMLKLDRNPGYWGGPAGYAKAELRYIPDGQVRATMVQTGEAQIATVLPVSVLRQPVRNVTVHSIALPRTTGFYLNTGQPPLNDVRVRQAIQAAIDTTAIAGSVYEGLVRPGSGPFAPTEPWGDPQAKPVPQDLKKATALLAAAGVKPNTIKIEILVYQERPELADVASVLQAELGEIGIAATIRVASYSALEPDLLAGRFTGMLLSRSHLTDVPDPGSFLLSDYSCKGGYNIAHFCQPELDSKIEAALALTDEKERFQRYSEIGTALERDVATVFLIHDQQRDAVSTSVKNFRTHPLGHYILTKDLAPAN